MAISGSCNVSAAREAGARADAEPPPPRSTQRRVQREHSDYEPSGSASFAVIRPSFATLLCEYVRVRLIEDIPSLPRSDDAIE